MNSGAYTTAEVADITGFTIRQLDYWARQGLAMPSVQPARGSGTRRLYSFDDLVQLRFIRRLRRSGWSVQKIHKATNLLRGVMNDPSPLKSAVLVQDKHTILAICKTAEGEKILLDTLDPGGQQMMWIFLEDLQRETSHVVANDTVELSV